MAFITDSRAATVTIADRFATLTSRFADAYTQRKLYNTTFNELNALSNAELADLGIHRSNIRAIALEAATK